METEHPRVRKLSWSVARACPELPWGSPGFAETPFPPLITVMVVVKPVSKVVMKPYGHGVGLHAAWTTLPEPTPEKFLSRLPWLFLTILLASP